MNPRVLAHKEAIQRASVALLRDHNVKQDTVFGWIRAALRESVQDLPKTRVLFNSCFGGYGLSKEFLTFMGCEDSHEEYREEGVKHIIPFAKSLLAKQELSSLSDVLYMYHKYDFSKIFIKISECGSIEQNTTNYSKNVTLLREYLAKAPTEEVLSDTCKSEPWKGMLTFNNVNFDVYYTEKLHQLLKECNVEGYLKDQNENLRKIHDELLDILGSDTILKEIAQFAATAKKHKDTISKKQSFVSALLTYGFDEPCVWEYRQSPYNHHAILYLIDKLKKEPGVDFIARQQLLDKVMDDTMFEKFGLLCASDRYADLRIRELPALVDYDIREYDGRESVTML